MGTFMQKADLTADGVEFAAWTTGFEDDDLELVSLQFANDRSLVAVFSSYQRAGRIRLTYSNTGAFRVLDEGGLLELWAASQKTPRPAQSMFRARGHRWQAESPLVWVHGSDENGFSYFVATDWHCLEVVTWDAPVVELVEIDS
jgi:hypothetical protein